MIPLAYLLIALSKVIHIACGLGIALLLARVVLGAIPTLAGHPATLMIVNVTEPLVAPIRRRLPPTPGLDLAALVAMLALVFIKFFLGGTLGTYGAVLLERIGRGG